jgi:AcrR family transcriptional regulator
MTAGVKQAYHHRDLRNALIDEALSVLASEGSSGLTLRELARRLGVTHAAPYAHFADKHALLEAVADEGFVRLADRLETAERESAEPAAALRRLSAEYMAFARENANLYRLMFADPELADDPNCELSPAGERAFAVVVRTMQRIGVPEGVDARDLAAGIWATVHGVCMLDIDKRINGKTLQSPQAVLSLLGEIVLRGLAGGSGG